MARITITAADTGFFTRSAIGAPMAPNAFLETRLNAAGTVISFDSTGFVSLESLRYDTQSIQVDAEIAAVITPQLGQQTMVTVSAVSFMRLEGSEMVNIGTINLPDPLTLTATYLSYGADDTPSWQFDLGLALEDALNDQSFKFIGGAGDDIFDPHLELMPYYGKGAIFGYDGNDTLTGTAGNDVISGGNGDDVINDNYGQNKLRGGFGDDTISVGNGSAGSILKGGAGNDTLISGWGNDTLDGGSGKDNLIGGRGNDTLYGKGGKDTLNGGAGADLISGGRSSDILTGGEGADVFLFNANQRGQDTITDFEGGVDVIKIAGLGGYSDLTFEVDGDDVLVESSGMSGTILIEDIALTGLAASDFLFV